MIAVVSDTYKCDWEKACRLNVYEFLNVYSYYIATQRLEQSLLKAEYDRIKSKHRH